MSLTDAEFEEQRQRILALIDRWQTCLGLRWWKVTHTYERGEYHSNGSYAPEVVANTAVMWEYLHATVTWNMTKVADQDADDLEYAFVHECMHVLVHEMRVWRPNGEPPIINEMEREHEERVCTQLAKAFIWTRAADRVEDTHVEEGW